MVDAHRRLPDGRTLSDVMDFDHPIRVMPDGTVTDAIREHAPNVHAYPSKTAGGPDEILVIPDNWRLMDGYSGQQGYRGPIMHPSEFIGGRMADDILSEPAVYVAVAVYGIDANCDSEECDRKGEGSPDCNHGIHGWAVATKPDYSAIYNSSDIKQLRRGLVAAIRAGDSERANAYAWQAGAVAKAEAYGMPVASASEYWFDKEHARARQTIERGGE